MRNIKLRNIVFQINTREGYRAVVYRRNLGRKNVRLFVIVKDSSASKCISEGHHAKLNDFYSKYVRNIKFNFRKQSFVAAIPYYDPWIMVKKEDLLNVIKELMKIFKN
jgi:hypothetical protein